MHLADLIGRTVTSFIKSKDDAELGAAFKLHVHPGFKLDVHGLKRALARPELGHKGQKT